MHKIPLTLYYIHDPMCSWCWGFRPTWQLIQAELPDSIQVQYILGGLAPDSNETMSKSMQTTIAGYWKNIQKHIPETEFNFDFWENCQPRRSTYPACRAVIAAKKQGAELAMIKAIQQAYYLQAKNPSDDITLINLAVSLKLDKPQFSRDINSLETQEELEQNITFSRQIGAQGFPSLVLKKGNSYKLIPLDYNDSSIILSNISNSL